MIYLQSQQVVTYSKTQESKCHPMLIPDNMLNYRIAAAFIYIHNDSTLDLLPSTVEKARYKLVPSFMEVQSHMQTEGAVLFQTKQQLPATWKVVPQNR